MNITTTTTTTTTSDQPLPMSVPAVVLEQVPQMNDTEPKNSTTIGTSTRTGDLFRRSTVAVALPGGLKLIYRHPRLIIHGFTNENKAHNTKHACFKRSIIYFVIRFHFRPLPSSLCQAEKLQLA